MDSKENSNLISNRTGECKCNLAGEKLGSSLDVRGYFAAMALQGILANTNGEINADIDTCLAVKFADALIKALERGGE